MIRRPFKLAIAGTHSTGKTTFLERLQTALAFRGLTVAYVHDSAVAAGDLGFPILTEHTFESTAWLMAAAMQLEARAALKAEVILVDRPVPDALGYLLAALRYTERTLAPGRYDRLEKICAAWAGEYNLLFLTQIDPAIEMGPGRDENSAFRLGAADAVTEIVNRHVPDRHILASDGVEASVSLALARVDAWHKEC